MNNDILYYRMMHRRKRKKRVRLDTYVLLPTHPIPISLLLKSLHPSLLQLSLLPSPRNPLLGYVSKPPTPNLLLSSAYISPFSADPDLNRSIYI